MSRHAYDSPGIGATNLHVGQRGRDNRHVLTRLSLWRTAYRPCAGGDVACLNLISRVAPWAKGVA